MIFFGLLNYDYSGTGTAGSLSFPNDAALDGNGTMYISDGQPRIRKVDLRTRRMTTVAGGLVSGYADGMCASLLCALVGKLYDCLLCQMRTQGLEPIL